MGPGEDGVDGHPGRRDFARDRLHEAGEPGPRRVRQQDVGDRLLHRHRGDVDDPPPPLADHGRHHGVGQPDRAHHRQLDGGPELVQRGAGEGAGRRPAGVAHHDVGLAQPVRHRADQRLDVARLRHVGREGDHRLAGLGRDLGGDPLYVLPGAGADGDPAALGGQGLGRAAPETLRGGGDERDLSPDSKIHSVSFGRPRRRSLRVRQTGQASRRQAISQKRYS